MPLELDFNIPNDGVVLHNSVLPGGANKIWTLGKTLVHEAGHVSSTLEEPNAELSLT